jgi:hypothetical protein
MAGRVMTGLTLRDLYALMLAEYGPIGWPVQGLPVYTSPGDRWVMDLAAYKQVRAACRAAGAVYPPGAGDKPRPEDRLLGLPVEVRADGGEPHIVRGRR